MSEPQPWTAWINIHGPQLVLFARRWATDQAEAEDIVQDAFIRFWRSRLRVEDPVAYLYQCVRSVAIDTSRSRRARVQRESDPSLRPGDSSSPVCPVEQDEKRRQIELAINDLPKEQSEVVVLKIWSELTFAQIAEVTGSPTGTVASRYRYAMERLSRTLSEEPTT